MPLINFNWPTRAMATFDASSIQLIRRCTLLDLQHHYRIIYHWAELSRQRGRIVQDNSTPGLAV